MITTSSIERIFQEVKFPLSVGYTGPKIYKELFLHFIHFSFEEDINIISSSKLDKCIFSGKYYKHSLNHNEITNEEQEQQVILYRPPDSFSCSSLLNTTDESLLLRLVAIAGKTATDRNNNLILK